MIKIEIENKEIGYKIMLASGENIKVLVDDVEKLNQTVSTGKQARVYFKFQEAIFE